MTYDQSQPPYPQPYPQQMPQYASPKKRHRWVPWVAYPAVLLTGVIIGSAGGETPAAEGAAPGATVTVTAAPEAKPAAKPITQPTKTTPPPAAPQAKKWTKLVTLTGSADKSGDTIKTTGGKVRITYSFKGSSIIGAIYLLDEGTDLQKDGGIPDVMVTEGGKDSTTIRKDAGEYYLKVSAANARYTVTVEEER